MKKFKIAGIVLSLLLVGCGSSDVTTVTSISQVEGVWDISETSDGLTDKAYLDIAADGTLTLYDYLGDEFDNEADCYDIMDFGTLHNNGNSSFQLDSPVDDTSITVTGKLQNNNLSITAYGQSVIWSSTTLTVEEMQMKSCENY